MPKLLVANIYFVRIVFLSTVLVFSQLFSHAQRARQQAQHVVTLTLMPAAILNMPGNPGKTHTPSQTPPPKSSKNQLVQTQVLTAVVSDKTTTTLPFNDANTSIQSGSQQNAAGSKYVIYTLSSL